MAGPSSPRDRQSQDNGVASPLRGTPTSHRPLIRPISALPFSWRIRLIFRCLFPRTKLMVSPGQRPSPNLSILAYTLTTKKSALQIIAS